MDFKEARESTEAIPVCKADESPKAQTDSRGGESLLSGGADEAASLPDNSSLVTVAGAPAAQSTLGGGVERQDTQDARGTAGTSPRALGEPASETGDSPAQSTLATTLDATVAFLQRYVSFDDDQAVVCALWAAATYVYELFDYAPILHIFSPAMGCGKSVLLKTLETIVSRPLNTPNISEAALFHEVEDNKPTLLLDEVDNLLVDESGPIVGLLNAGWEKGKPAIRCSDGGRGKNERYDTFCPKALTGIGKVPKTTADRCLHIRMTRKIKSDETSKFRMRLVKPVSEPLRKQLEAVMIAIAPQLATAEVDFPKEFDGRDEDNTEPLLAIADAAGGEWPEKARDAVVGVCAKEKAIATNEQLLSCVRNVILTKDVSKISTLELLQGLIDEDGPWAGWWENDVKRGSTQGPSNKLSKILGEFGIKSHNLRFGSDQKKGYLRADFIEPWSRYLDEPVIETAELDL